MTIKRMDHVGIIVDDLEAAVAFFGELGMEREGDGSVEGAWVDRVNAMDDVRVDIVMMRTPDGIGRVELTRFLSPALSDAEPTNAPPNTLGIRQIMFEVDDLEDTVARLRQHGAQLIGEIARYEDAYLICYVRGPAGIILALAEAVG